MNPILYCMMDDSQKTGRFLPLVPSLSLAGNPSGEDHESLSQKNLKRKKAQRSAVKEMDEITKENAY